MKLKLFLCSTSLLAVLLLPIAAMAMIPSTCGIFRHWSFLEGLHHVKGEKARGIFVYRFDLDVDGDGRGDLFLSSPSTNTQDKDYRVMHIYSQTSDGKSFVYLGKLALSGFRHDAGASRLVGIEVDPSNGRQTLKAYSVSSQGLVVDRDFPVPSEPAEVEAEKATMSSWAEKSQKQWWHTELMALQANVWESAALMWTGEATSEKSKLSNGLFNVKVSWDRSPGKSKAKSECKTMKR